MRGCIGGLFYSILFYCVQECTNAVTIHRFDQDTGRIYAHHHSVASLGSGPRGLGCGMSRCLVSLLPLKPILPLKLALLGAARAAGLSAVAEGEASGSRAPSLPIGRVS